VATIDDFGSTGDSLDGPKLGGPDGWAAAVRDAIRRLERSGLPEVQVSITTLDPDDEATLTETIENGVLTLHFGVPQGVTGDTGPANTLAVGTVTTLSSGAVATAEITGTSPEQTINLGIPRGDTSDAPDAVLLTAYGADPTGVADSSTAVKNALAASTTGKGRTVRPTQGTFRVTAAAADRIVKVPPAGRWSLVADPGAVLKHSDASVTGDWATLMRVQPLSTDADRVVIEGLAFDGNRRGQTLPPGTYDWEHSACLMIGGTTTGRLRTVVLRDLDFSDPLADCIWSNTYYVDTLIIDGVTVRDRAAVRSDISLSGLPRVTQINNFVGFKLEAEPVAIPAAVTHDFLLQISNAEASTVTDIAGVTTRTLTVQIDNLRTGNLAVAYLAGTIANSRITYPLSSERRQIGHRGLVYENCDFYLTADAGGVVAPILIESTQPGGVTFRRCRFHIVPQDGYTGGFTGAAIQLQPQTPGGSLAGATLTAAGDLVTSPSHGLTAGTRVVLSSLTAGGLSTTSFYWVTNPTTDTFQLSTRPGGGTVADITSDGTATITFARAVENVIEGCWFDPRFQRSVYADRTGSLRLSGNDYAGTSEALYLSYNAAGYLGRIVVEGGVWDRAARFAAIPANVGGQLILRGITIPAAAAAWAVPSGSPANLVFDSSRILIVDAAPTSQPGIIGDRARLRTPVAGQPCEWVCTASSTTAATWKATTTVAA